MRNKKCAECKKSFTPYKPLQKVCSVGCAVKQSKKTIQKKERVKKRVMKERLMTPTQKVKKVRIVFQKFIRLRDKDQPCISCGTMTASMFHAGHYLKAELFPGLIFNELNCHKQCVKCNYFLDGNELNYRKGLIQKLGEDVVIELEDSKDKHRFHRYTQDELDEIRLKYLKKIKDLDI